MAVVRYLKPLVTQLCYSLVPQPHVRLERSLQLAAVKALRSVVNACGGRMAAYRKDIVAAVAKCWTQIVDESAEAFGEFFSDWIIVETPDSRHVARLRTCEEGVD